MAVSLTWRVKFSDRKGRPIEELEPLIREKLREIDGLIVHTVSPFMQINPKPLDKRI